MMTPLKRFSLLLKPDQKEIYQVYTYAVFKGAIALSLPLGIQTIINLIQGGRVSASWVVLVSIVVLGIALGGYMQLMQMRIMENIQQRIFTRAAFDFTYRLPKIKFEAIYKHYAPELMNRFFDVLTLQKGLSKMIIDFSSAVLQIVFGLLLLSLYHPFFILFSVFLVLLVIVIIKLTYKRGLDSSLSESKYKYKVVSWLEELARSMVSFKLAGNTRLPEIKTDKLVSSYIEYRENHYRILVMQYSLLLMFKVLTALGLLIAGGLLVLEQQMNIGQFVAAEIIILLVIDSSEKIILNLENIFDILTSLEKIGQIVDLEIEENQDNSSLSLKTEQAIQVSLTSITYAYPEQNSNTIENLSYTFHAGKNYVIKGDNYSGKSTLLHLISGVYQPQKGNICINDYPFNNYNINQLYSAIGNGLTEETIFEGSVLENITLGRDFITQEELNIIIERLKLTDFIKSLPKGIDSPLKNAGVNIPESVIQKLLIARSIINKPKLLLLETRLDRIGNDDKKNIIDFLTDKRNGWTLIAISNDEYFTAKSDIIITMKNGAFINEHINS